MKRILMVIDIVSSWSGKATSVLCVFMVFAILSEIVLRYVLNIPTQWVTESAVFCGALVYVIAGAWTLLMDQHVKVDFIYDKLSDRTKAVLDAFTFIFFAIYLIAMLWATGMYAWDSIAVMERTGSAWNPPVYPIKAAFMVGVGLLLVQGVAKFIRDLYFAMYGKRFER